MGIRRIQFIPLSEGVKTSDFNSPEPAVFWRTEVLRDRRAVLELEAAYRELFDSLPDPNPFLSPEWVYVWINTLGSRFVPCFLVCFERDVLRGVWPFFEQPVPALRPLLLPVAAQVADLFEPVADSAAAALLGKALVAVSGNYLAVWLPLLGDAFVAGGFRDFLRKTNAPSLVRRRAARLQIDLHAHPDFEGYAEATFQSRTRQGLRRKRRRLEEHGVVEFSVCETPEALEREMSAVVRLERASWKHAGRAGIFKDAAHNAFYFILLQELARKRRVRLSLLRVGGSVAAFELGVLGIRSYGMHTMAFDPQFASFSPGRLLALSVVEKCFAEGRSRYDFMQNEQVFKRQMANREENFWDCILLQRGVVGWLIFLVIRVLDFWKSGRRKPGLKQEPQGDEGSGGRAGVRVVSDL